MDKRRTAKEWLSKYELYLLRTAARTTYLRYGGIIYNFLKFFPERKYAEDFHRADIEDYKLAQINRGLGPRSVNLELDVLRSWFTWLQEVAELPIVNPASRSKRLTTPVAPRRALNPLETQKLLLSAANDKQKLMLKLALSTGLRANTLAQLQWSEVDWTGKRLCVAGEKFKNKQGKEVPLRDDVIQLLQQLKPSATQTGTDRIFPSAKTLREWLLAATRTAGLGRRVRLHDLRHTFATQMLRNGCDIKTVQVLLGHSSVATTGVYISPADDAEIREAIEKLPD